MIINDLCDKWTQPWVKSFMHDFLNDLPEHYRTKAPKKLYQEGLFEIFAWFCDRCEPPYKPDQLDELLTEALQP